MEFWGYFTESLFKAIGYFSLELGITEAVAVILFTLIIRLVLSPISTSSMITSYRNKRAMAAIKPELDELKTRYKDDSKMIMQQSMEIYRKNNIKFFDKISILNMSSQGVLGIGMFQMFQQAIFHGRFAWIANISKPDILLAIAVGILTFVTMLMLPGNSEQVSVFVLAIPAIVSIAVLLSAPSALGIYWATSNIFSIIQSVIIKSYHSKIR
ncbi:membrane protein insertase YidC [Shewanella sp. A25]|nr:membrane protein insertase YidC [Shewanella shenzhenensis]